MHYVIDSCWVLYHNVIIYYASGYGSPMGLIFLIEQKMRGKRAKWPFFRSTILRTRRSHLRNQTTMARISAAGGSQHHQSLPRRIESIAIVLG